MVVSADTLRLAIVEETTPGVTPTAPQWKVVRTTGEGLAFAPQATFSNEMDASRGVRDSILTGGEVTGDINFELSYNLTALDLFEGAFCSDWGDLPSGLSPATTLSGFTITNLGTRTVGINDLFIGTEMKTYTVEKRFALDTGGFAYHRYNGCIVNTLSVNITPNEPINGTFGMLGRGMVLATTEIASSAYQDPGVRPVFTALNVGALNFDTSGADMHFDGYCFNGLTLNLTNNARRTACIGPDTFAQTVLGRSETTLDANVYFSDNLILQWLQQQTDVAIRIILLDTDQPTRNKFIFYLPRAKVQTGQVVASGTGQDVIANATFAGLIPASPAGMTPLVLSKETGVPYT
jgi:Phage tail tube protein